MDNEDGFEKLVEIVISNTNTSIKVGDVLTILQLIGKSLEEEEIIDTRLANTIIFRIIAGLATKLDPDKADKILDNYMNNIKENLS